MLCPRVGGNAEAASSFFSSSWGCLPRFCKFFLREKTATFPFYIVLLDAHISVSLCSRSCEADIPYDVCPSPFLTPTRDAIQFFRHVDETFPPVMPAYVESGGDLVFVLNSHCLLSPFTRGYKQFLPFLFSPGQSFILFFYPSRQSVNKRFSPFLEIEGSSSVSALQQASFEKW